MGVNWFVRTMIPAWCFCSDAVESGTPEGGNQPTLKGILIVVEGEH